MRRILYFCAIALFLLMFLIGCPVVEKPVYMIIGEARPSSTGTVNGEGLFSEAFRHGDRVTLKAEALEGYEFGNWTEDEEVISDSEVLSFKVTRNRILAANFERKSYVIVSSAAEGGSIEPSGLVFVLHGEDKTFSVSAHEGYEIKDVLIDGESAGKLKEYTFENVLQDRTIHAEFVSLPVYTVEFGVRDEDGPIGDALVVFDSREKTTDSSGVALFSEVPIGAGKQYSVIKPGYEDVTGSIDVLDHDVSVVIVMTRRSHTLVTKLDGKGEVIREPNQSSYLHGSIVELTGNPDQGWEFNRWSGDYSGTENPAEVMMDADKVITAHFTRRHYDVAVTTLPPDSGYIRGTGVYLHGDSVTLEAIPISGWNFIEWTENERVIGSESPYEFVIESDRYINAHFQKKSYVIDAVIDPPEGGTVSGGGIYEHGTEITVSVSPDEGWSLVGWYENGRLVSTSTEYRFTVFYGRELVAVVRPAVGDATVLGQIQPYTGNMQSSSDETVLQDDEGFSQAFFPEVVEDEYIVQVFSERVADSMRSANLSDNFFSGLTVIDELVIDDLGTRYLLVHAKPSDIEGLYAHAGVGLIEPNYYYYTCQIPDDPFYSDQWHYPMIQLPQAWTISTGSELIVVAVIDTGVRFDHPDLQGVFYDGWDFVDDNDDPSDEGDPSNKSVLSHGTHVAGTIATLTDNGTGVAGVTWGGPGGVRIIPIRVLDTANNGGGTAFNLAKGILYAVEHGARVINLSLGSLSDSSLVHDACKYAHENGVVIVAAAGNWDGRSIRFPARYPETIAVGAVGPDEQRAVYSNHGPEMDIVAPGGDRGFGVLSTSWSIAGGHGYYPMQGTSMATPHVAGLVALIMSQGVFDVDTVRSLLHSTAKDLGLEGFDNHYGYGLIQAYNALSSITEQQPFFVFAQNTITEEYYSTLADVSGQFALRDLPPGEYYVYSWVDVNSDGAISTGDLFGFYGYEGGDPLAIDPLALPVKAGETLEIAFCFGVVLDTSTRPLHEYVSNFLEGLESE